MSCLCKQTKQIFFQVSRVSRLIQFYKVNMVSKMLGLDYRCKKYLSKRKENHINIKFNLTCGFQLPKYLKTQKRQKMPTGKRLCFFTKIYKSALTSTLCTSSRKKFFLAKMLQEISRKKFNARLARNLNQQIGEKELDKRSRPENFIQ